MDKKRLKDDLPLANNEQVTHINVCISDFG